MGFLPRAASAALRDIRGAFRAGRAARARTGTHEPNEKSAAILDHMLYEAVLPTV